MFATLMLSLFACPHRGPQVVTNPNLTPPTASVSTASQQEAVSQMMENFSRVHFATDSSQLDTQSQAALAANAHILDEHRDLRVEVQGHADERGTIDYNLALGQRRANAVVGYLVDQGVAPSRLPVVSYGEERPVADGSTEVAWAENRRAEFRIVAGTPGVQGTTAN
jgi:peptidoglycan-associated lipoprotein